MDKKNFTNPRSSKLSDIDYCLPCMAGYSSARFKKQKDPIWNSQAFDVSGVRFLTSKVLYCSLRPSPRRHVIYHIIDQACSATVAKSTQIRQNSWQTLPLFFIQGIDWLINCCPRFFISSSFSGVSISEFWQMSLIFRETLCLSFWPLCFGVTGGAFLTFGDDGFRDSLRATWGRGWSLEGIVAGSGSGVPRVISSCSRDNAPKSRSFINVKRLPNPGSFSHELFWNCCRNKTARKPNDDATTTESDPPRLPSNIDPSTCRSVALSIILNSSGKLWTTKFFRKYWLGLLPQRLEVKTYQYLSRELSSSLITRVKGEKPFLGAILPLKHDSWLRAASNTIGQQAK